MPVARIKEAIRKFLRSIFSLVIIMIFISRIPISIHNVITVPSKYTNFNEINNKTNNIFIQPIHNKDDVEKELINFLILLAKIWLYGTNFIICCLLLQYLCCCILNFDYKYRRRRMRYCLNKLSNWLFRRNQDNEPAVHYQDNKIIWIRRETSV